MPADGDEMERCPDEDEAVPDRVSEWYDTIALEENDSYDVEGATGSQFRQTGRLFLFSHNLVNVIIEENRNGTNFYTFNESNVDDE